MLNLLVPGNLLVVLVVTLSRRLRSVTNFFLANLALADICVGVFCVFQNLSIYLITRYEPVQQHICRETLSKAKHFFNLLNMIISPLQKLKSCRLLYLGDHFVYLIRVLIVSTQNSVKTVNLIWIPGHFDIVDNNIADSLAKQGASNLIITLINHNPLPDFFSIFKGKSRSVWA